MRAAEGFYILPHGRGRLSQPLLKRFNDSGAQPGARIAPGAAGIVLLAVYDYLKPALGNNPKNAGGNPPGLFISEFPAFPLPVSLRGENAARINEVFLAYRG